MIKVKGFVTDRWTNESQCTHPSAFSKYFNSGLLFYKDLKFMKIKCKIKVKGPCHKIFYFTNKWASNKAPSSGCYVSFYSHLSYNSLSRT